jgi:hypothetical protein
MRTETNKDQLDNLVLILTEMVNTHPPEDIAQDVVFDHVLTAYNKMRVRSEQIMPRSGYKVSLTDQEARCLYLFAHNSFIPVDRYKYGALHLQSLLNLIHQKYAIRIRTVKPDTTKAIGSAVCHIQR